MLSQKSRRKLWPRRMHVHEENDAKIRIYWQCSQHE